MISGKTLLIAHLGYPTESFKAPMIYNPYFQREGIDAVVVPMGCRGEDYPDFLKLFFRLSNAHGALVTMPHKVTTVGLLERASPAVRIAGACNAVRRGADGALERLADYIAAHVRAPARQEDYLALADGTARMRALEEEAASL